MSDANGERKRRRRRKPKAKVPLTANMNLIQRLWTKLKYAPHVRRRAKLDRSLASTAEKAKRDALHRQMHVRQRLAALKVEADSVRRR